jgi:hypothetical protein
MRDRTAHGLLADRLAQSHCCALASATGTIWFSERFVTAQAPEPSFVEHHFDLMPSQRHITFAAGAYVVSFDTHVLAVRAPGSIIGSHHFDPNRSIWLYLLLKHPQPL